MTQARKSPRRHAGASRDVLSKLKQTPTTTKPSIPVGKFWLRILYDGREVRFKREPNPPHLTVEVIDVRRGRWVEQTRTWFIKVRLGGGMANFAPKPRGRGWELYQDEVKDGATGRLFAIWRRPCVKGDAR
jgi:hypothetical protein